MAITFTYTESTNIVVQTEGTSGTPATFANFVTADRAGTDTKLLDAGSPASDLALTYAVRPVEDLAILVKCVVANKTAEADFIFITGTNWRGAAQTESIDVTAGNGSYTTTKYWASITILDCSDNAAGGGTVWADGDLTVTQDVWGVIWNIGNYYKIDCKIEIGNGSTSTYFGDTEKFVELFDPATAGYTHFLITTNAHFYIGTSANDADKATHSGCVFKVNNSVGHCQLFYNNSGSYLRLYSSVFSAPNRTRIYEMGSECKIWNCLLIKKVELRGLSGADLYNITIQGAEYSIDNTSGTLDEIKVMYPAIYTYVNDVLATATISNLYGRGATTSFWMAKAGFTLYLVNPDLDPWTFAWTQSGTCYRQYTINIHIVDKDGVNLANVTVLCEDKDSSEIFSVNTDANGDITEQTITYGTYDDGHGNTLQSLSPHEFTISKAGYETLVLENITVDEPIVWHLELQPKPGRVGTLIATELDKDTSSQKVSIYAYDSIDGNGETGDAANITAQISIDGGATAATNDTNPTELDATDAPGIYIFDLTQAETNGDMIVISAASSTSNIKINPIMIRTKSYIEKLSQRHHGI